MTSIPKPLPIGTEFFDQMIEKDYYYVDKTLLIKELLDKKALVSLFTRPRRFGKTLTQTMLKCFFEDTSISVESREKRVESEEKNKPLWAKDKRHLFNGLKIEQVGGGRYMEEQGQYPVVFLTLKGAKQDSWELSYTSLKKDIADEFKRHDYLLKNEQLLAEKELYERIMQCKGNDEDYNQSLKFLSKCLETHHNKKTIILIDEYDVPLENSWFRGFYDKMISFIRSFLESALKTNDSLEFAVLTGCLRISKESIFTGLNNLQIISILNKNYSEYFGFTPIEAESMLHYYDLDIRLEDFKSWYNGYLFGETQVYNPWSVINATSDIRDYTQAFLRPYWSNTSSNGIVRTLVDKADGKAKADLETLITGGSIQKIIHEDITYDEMENSIENIWNFLFFTGYLTKACESIEGEKIVLDLKIPNRELHYIFETKIQDWFKEKIRQKDFSKLYAAVINGEAETFEEELATVLETTISFYDSAENFYHGFLTGVLSGLDKYIVKSNRESGNGRGDIFMKYISTRGKAIVFEIKIAGTPQEMGKKCDEALAQIEEKKYEAEFIAEGYKDSLKYGVAFCGKNCKVKI
ncbi:hypothetical protein AGMMS49938_11590 [Fibrobacterales bacterium]|nr:hypothetical protein AGMMS49938_11590 [Fibrobacterales bacterium]